MTALPEISGEAATRFELLLAAATRGNRPLAVGMLLSISAADLAAIEARLARCGIDLSDLMRKGLPR